MEENTDNVCETETGDESKDINELGLIAEDDPPILDLTNTYIKPDHFEGIHIMDQKFPSIEGAPNFRQVPGFPVFGTGQPTIEGMVEILKKIKKDKENEKIIWFSMRQEPVVYVNGSPYAPRSPDKVHENILTDIEPHQIRSVCVHLANVLKKRVDATTKTIKIHVDREFAENPLDRVDLEETVVVDNIKDLDSVYDYCREQIKINLQIVRIPAVEDQTPTEACFDKIISVLKDEPASTSCVFSCQMGKGRTTAGLIAACLIKEIQITTELKQMVSDKLIKSETLKDLIYEKFEKPLIVSDEEDDPLTKGDFEVIKQLCATLTESEEAKRKIDIIIDKCGPPPRGVGINNLRECIMETKWKYDVATEDKQFVFKANIINFIERYFYFICYATYSLEFGPTGYQKTFQDWMEGKKDLEAMVKEGKDKLEWSRTVDAGKLEQLKKLLNDPNYKDNLSLLIRTILEFAYQTYSDLPRGQIKNNSMRKLAATTLMEILPHDVATKVTKKLEDDPNITHDFLSIVGLVSYF